jgi:glycosyltransferase involved in cell wall biosynthesis
MGVKKWTDPGLFAAVQIAIAAFTGHCHVKFSLIVGTLGRSAELAKLFDSLVVQTHHDFEIIVVDQNDDDRAKLVVDRFIDRLNILHLTSAKGLSRARNVGLAHVTGDVVAFPDDDCCYPRTVLETVAKELSGNVELSGLTGRSVDKNGRDSQGRWATKPLFINKFNVWVCATSYTIFLRASMVAEVGSFDEKLGVGAGTPWGAGEEVNFLIQCLRHGRVRYYPNLCIQHPEPVAEFNDRAFARALLYNRGYGRVLSLNHFPLYFVFYTILRPAFAIVVSILRFNFPRARYYNIVARERFLGWRDK